VRSSWPGCGSGRSARSPRAWGSASRACGTRTVRNLLRAPRRVPPAVLASRLVPTLPRRHGRAGRRDSFHPLDEPPRRAVAVFPLGERQLAARQRRGKARCHAVRVAEPPVPTACDTSIPTAASSELAPLPMAAQTAPAPAARTPLAGPATESAPVKLSSTLPRSHTHSNLFIEKVLRRSAESAQYTSWPFGQHLHAAGLPGSTGSAGDCFDNALGRKLLLHADRTPRGPPLGDSSRAGRRDLRMDRSVLQPRPPPLRPGIPVPGRLRTSPHAGRFRA
jgi:hypothetical protein